MKTEPEVSHAKIKAWLKQLYNMDAAGIIFVPKGECSWGYLVASKDRALHYLKIAQKDLCSDSLMTPQIVKTLMALYYDHGIRQMSQPPVRAKTGDYVNDIEGYQVTLTRYITGMSAEEIGLNEKNERRLGALLATLHKCKLHPAERPPTEEFWPQMAEQIQRILHEIDYPDGYYTPMQSHLLQMLRGIKAGIQRVIEQFTMMQQQLRGNTALYDEFVICHSDPSSGNIIITPDDDLILIDWDSPVYGPRERDLYFIRNKPLALASYQQVNGEYVLNEEIIQFYDLQWAIQEIIDYSRRVLFRRQSEIQNKHDIVALTDHLRGMDLI